MQHPASKLDPLGLSPPYVHLDTGLSDRLQSVPVGRIASNTIPWSTCSPLGCMLSPLLFTLMTHECCVRFDTNHILKYAENTTVEGLSGDKEELVYREEVKHLV